MSFDVNFDQAGIVLDNDNESLGGGSKQKLCKQSPRGSPQLMQEPDSNTKTGSYC